MSKADDEFNERRRFLIRGVMAAGGAWCLSALGVRGTAYADSGNSDSNVRPPEKAAVEPKTGKVSQSEVKYRSTPNGEHRCGNCQHFIPPDRCKVVDGQVEAGGWCALWLGKVA